MEQKLEQSLESIRGHIKVLNPSSERMVRLLDEVEDELSDLGARVAAIEANMGWLMRLIWVILGGIIMIVFRVFADAP